MELDEVSELVVESGLYSCLAIQSGSSCLGTWINFTDNGICQVPSLSSWSGTGTEPPMYGVEAVSVTGISRATKEGHFIELV